MRKDGKVMTNECIELSSLVINLIISFHFLILSWFMRMFCCFLFPLYSLLAGIGCIRHIWLQEIWQQLSVFSTRYQKMIPMSGLLSTRVVWLMESPRTRRRKRRRKSNVIRSLLVEKKTSAVFWLVSSHGCSISQFGVGFCLNRGRRNMAN